MDESGRFPIQIERKIRLMQNIAFFSDFSETELSDTALMSEWLKFSCGDHIAREGDVGASFWILLKGTVSVVKKISGQPVGHILAVIPTGECFGEMSIISGKSRSADILANEEVFLFKIEAFMLEKADVALQLKFYKRFSEILVNRLMRTSNLNTPATK